MSGHSNIRHDSMSSSPPIKVRVNTFVNNSSLDTPSKIIIFSELALGLDRFSILGKQKSIFVALTFVYAVLFKCAIILLTYVFDIHIFTSLIFIIKLVQYAFLCIFSQVVKKRLRCYYDELEKFDTEVGCKPKTTWSFIRTVVQLCLVIIYTIPMLYIHPRIGVRILLPLQFINSIENHYYGHLLNLLIPRIRLINLYLESSLSNDKILKSSDENEFIFCGNRTTECRVRMNRFMDLYLVIIRAHSLLIHAIKWQLLVIIITSFLLIFYTLYRLASDLLSNLHMEAAYTLTSLGVAVAEMIPLFAPCLSCDQVRAEVRRLRELLASILFENRLEKPCRSVSRAFLTLTESRDLSFSLLRVIDISISLPFTFMGLLVTYVIIMLQFQKVNKD